MHKYFTWLEGHQNTPSEKFTDSPTYRLVVKGEWARCHDLLHVLAAAEVHERITAAVLPLAQVNPKSRKQTWARIGERGSGAVARHASKKAGTATIRKYFGKILFSRGNKTARALRA